MMQAVQEIRSVDPGIGGYKLWLMLCDVFGREWMPGRDAFLSVLRRHKLLRPPLRRRHTTSSNHRYHKWKNLVKGYLPMAPNRLWVSDITYIDTDEGCCYLHLVTDAYSRKIVGWRVSASLGSLSTLDALRMAIAQTGKDDLEGLIHHSDRGVQYCCDLYVEELQKHHISISMTEDYKPTDNALAERVNATVKTERVYATPPFQGPGGRAKANGRVRGLLHYPPSAHEHRHADSRTGAYAERGAAEMLENENIPARTHAG